jgi:hypothetical protein
MRKITLLTLLLLVFSFPALATEKEDLEKKKMDNINYSQGHAFGKKLSTTGAQFRVEDFLTGVYDAQEKVEPRLDEKAQTELLKAKEISKAQTADLNYSFGYSAGIKFVKKNIELSPDAMVEGLFDALERLDPRLEEAEMTKLLSGLDGDKK